MWKERKLKNGLYRVYCPICGAPMYDVSRTETPTKYGVSYNHDEIVQKDKDTSLIWVKGLGGAATVCIDCYNAAHPQANGAFDRMLTEEKFFNGGIKK